jgi:hypothetical protein
VDARGSKEKETKLEGWETERSRKFKGSKREGAEDYRVINGKVLKIEDGKPKGLGRGSGAEMKGIRLEESQTGRSQEGKRAGPEVDQIPDWQWEDGIVMPVGGA